MPMIYLNGEMMCSIDIFYMSSASLWKRQHSLLEEEASNISSLKKQILKESEIDATVQLSLNQQIDSLKKKGALLAKKLEQEKHKHLELQTVISYKRDKMERDRAVEATARGGSNSDNLASLDNKYKKLQYDLGQVNGKVNRLTQSVEQKRTKINQNRMERVIDSGIFRNIEKELASSELTFKKLLIDQIKHQKEYYKLLDNYEEIKNKAQSLSSIKSKNTRRTEEGGELETARQEDCTAGPPFVNNKFTQLEHSAKYNNSRVKSITPNMIDLQLDAEEEQKIITVKKVMIETGVERAQEFPESLEEVEKQNDILFNQMNNHMDQINEIDKYLKSIQSSMAKNQMKFYGERKEESKAELRKKASQKITTLIGQVQLENGSAIHQIREFFKSESFRGLLQSVGLVAPEGEVKDFDEQKVLLQAMERKVQVYLRQGQRVVNIRHNDSDKLQEMINRVRRQQENDKVMGKQDFKEQYRRIVKNATQKSLAVNLSHSKKKSVANLRKN